MPTFLGIGVDKAGTTWLHSLLQSHSKIWMPYKRKEVNFFNVHYEKGFNWYENFFPKGSQKGKYKEVGEYSPGYFYDKKCPPLISEVKSIKKFILSLRNPVDRLYSAYGHRVRNYNYRKSFQYFVKNNKKQVKHGFYYTYLKRYLSYFEKRQILILKFENLFSGFEETKNKISDFLGVRRELFPDEELGAQNATFVPRFRRAFAVSQTVIRALKRWEMGQVLNFLKRTGIGPFLKKMFGKQKKEHALPSMDPEIRERLARMYLPEIEDLEALTGMDFSVWKRNLPL